MSDSYAPKTPRGKDNNPKVGYIPTVLRLANAVRENASASSVTSLTHNTTELEITAVGQGMAGRWAANQATSVITVVASPAFDFVVPSGETRRFVIPRETSGSYASVQGVNRAEGLYQNIATKTLTGAGSVLLAEY